MVVLLSFSGNSALWVLIAGFGGFGRVGSNPGVCKGWTGRVGHLLGFFGSGDWLPCVLAWWGLLSLSGYDACWVIKPTRAPGEIPG